MAKDPAFLFYSQDFIVGVQTMTFEDRGKYITILAQMHQQGRLSEETICFLVGSISVNLRLKFKQDEKGLWYNERLEAETKKRNEFTESRRLNGKNGGRPKKEKPNAKPNEKHKQNHMVNHMGNEDDNEIVIKNKVRKEKAEIVFPFQSYEFKEAWHNWKEYKSQEWKFNYKSATSEQAALMELNQLSNGDESKAKAIILQSITKGWKGFFELKTQNNGIQSHTERTKDLINGLAQRTMQVANKE